jgi:hypothetical protein
MIAREGAMMHREVCLGVVAVHLMEQDKDEVVAQTMILMPNSTREVKTHLSNGEIWLVRIKEAIPMDTTNKTERILAGHFSSSETNKDAHSTERTILEREVKVNLVVGLAVNSNNNNNNSQSNSSQNLKRNGKGRNKKPNACSVNSTMKT